MSGYCLVDIASSLTLEQAKAVSEATLAAGSNPEVPVETRRDASL